MATDSTSSAHARWIEPEPLDEEARQLTDWPLLSAVLHARGIRTPQAAGRFLQPAAAPLGNPFLLPDMDRAVATIRDAIERGQRIAVFGDYDVDGITSTAMLTRVLRRMGGDVLPIVPHRYHDGYGVSASAVQHIIASGAQLAVTVDCGSSSPEEFGQLLSRGMAAVVLDHHHTSSGLPDAVAFVSPRREHNQYPCTELAAVGVAYTLVRALLGDEDAEMYLPYVAIGTVADVVELLGENRTLVARGLAKLRRWRLPGIMALCAAAGIDQTAVGSWEIGYVIGPRINAAGRIDTPQTALDLLLADDAATATPLALKLSELNERRQHETRRVIAEAEQVLRELGGGDAQPAIVLADERWTSGVVGLVAGRLAETYNRPTVILERGDSVSRGSARSAGVVDIVAALGASSDLFERFGGHRDAAGLTIANDRIADLQRELSATVLDLCGGTLPEREIRLDAIGTHADLRLDTVELLRALEPFGRGNEEPCILFRGLRHRYCKRSRDGRHLLFQAIDDTGRANGAVFFGSGHRLEVISSTARVDVAACLRRDTWGDRPRLKLHLADFRAAQPA
jgi:single-stranded-DNA-specific exonuclease